ncbi:MAG: DnaJ domain-containing protein [Candidatus Thermoplasmatota archaeon]|nr:DnaJ domain-containing protein [Candidatus Thermoplasmatota archaeon]
MAGHEIRPGLRSSLRFQRTVICSLILSIIAVTMVPLMTAGTSSRAGAAYIGEIDGLGPDKDLLLAGHRYYTALFTFEGVMLEDLRYINISITYTDPPVVSIPTIFYDVKADEISLSDDAKMKLGTHSIGGNVTHVTEFSIDILFHLNWTERTRFKLVPNLDYGIGPISIPPGSDLHVTLHGVLDRPKPERIIDEKGRVLSEGSTVRSNSTIGIENVMYPYWHTTYNLTAFTPMRSEIEVFIDDGSAQYGPDEATSTSFHIVTPVELQGEWNLRMSVEGVRSDWWQRIAQWSLNLKLDGYGPTFDLTKPSGKVAKGEVDWTVVINERPTILNGRVDGSSIRVRVFSDDVWTEWQNVSSVPNGRSIIVYGSYEIQSEGISYIMFTASDELGNHAESQPFEVYLDHAPILTVPAEYTGLKMRTDEVLTLNGFNFTTDEDDELSQLRYHWKFNDEEIGTGKTINKPLFAESPGMHVITLTVSDNYETAEISFEIELVEAPKEGNGIDLIKLFKDENFQIIGIVILTTAFIILIAVIIIVVVRRLGKSDLDDSDFIISEDAAKGNEEIARKLRDMYSQGYTIPGPNGEADAREDFSGEEFDFDYNLYEVLGLENNSSPEQIKRAYRKLAAHYHPDRVAQRVDQTDSEEAREMMVRINKAKEFLLDPEKKLRYDSHLQELDFSIEM